VRTQDGPLSGALVRIKATDIFTYSDEVGRFNIGGIAAEGFFTVTAWHDGYYVGWTEAELGDSDLVIELKPYYTSDNPEYTWFSIEGEDGSISCSHCMPCYEEWIQDAHSQSAVNPRFLTMYNGTDMSGNQSPLTRYASNRDYGIFPLRPDPNEPYYGPGYKLDFPTSAGNCATCHVPAATAKPGMAYAVDPNDISGIDKEGVFCEFCHKIGDVILDPHTGLPYPNMPGTLSLRLYRPEGEAQLFFGNFDDVTRRVSYLPLYEESAYCAACHFGMFWDVVVYNSYGEWLASPYSDPETGKTCQDCHMPPVDYDYFVYPEKGGLIRDRDRIYSHLMPGALDQEFIQNGLSVAVKVARENREVLVQVDIDNDNTGHHIPTDSPLRHLILVVEVEDMEGGRYPLIEGSVLPDWTGVGNPDEGYYAGLPGEAYAKILQEVWTMVYPSAAYWNPIILLSDNRIAAFETASSTYRFSSSKEEAVNIRVRLIFRRAFIELVDQKGWDTPDILVYEENLPLAGSE
jgi:hypothetical protein